MKTRLYFPLILLLIVFPLFAQDSPEAPPEPEVELPELSLSFDEHMGEVLPLLELELDEALDAAAPDSLDPGDLAQLSPAEIELQAPEFDALPYGSDSAPLYGRGYIGFGNANYLRGEVEIATLGADPGFGLSYAHRSLDGFGTHSPGEGFTFRREAVRGEAEYAGFGGDLQFTGSFIEEERGLQGIGTYTSALRRGYGLDLGYSKYPYQGWFRSLELSGEGDYQNLAGTAPVDTTHLTLGPDLEFGYDWGNIAIGLAADYRLRTAPGDSGLHYGRLMLTGESDLGASAGISGRIGGSWTSTGDFQIPAELRLNAGLSGNLSLELTGTHFYRLVDYSPLFDENPFLRIPDQVLETEEGIEAAFLLRYRLGEGLYLTAGSGYTAGTIYRSGDKSESGSPLLPVVMPDVREITPEAGLDFPLGKSLFGSFSALMRYDYQETDAEELLFSLSLERDALNAGSGFALRGDWDTLAESSLPRVGGEAWWAPLSGVRFILDLQDLLSPLADQGRIDASGLELPGIVVSLAAEISL